MINLSFPYISIARKKDTGKFYAVKQINKNESINQPTYVINERDMLLEAPEDFFSKLKYSFQTVNDNAFANLKGLILKTESYYLIMKFYLGGDFHHYILQRKSLSEKRAKECFAQILTALEVLHKNRIIFRDLKVKRSIEVH